MVAMIYALNDADEDIREEAADEIGDQLVKNPCCCCCCKEVVAALKAALIDCDRSVRREAEKALEACGYCIVGGCCNTYDSGYGSDPHKAEGPAPAAPMDNKAAPAPMPPPADPKVYFPSRLRPAKPLRSARRSPLADLFGLFD